MKTIYTTPENWIETLKKYKGVLRMGGDSESGLVYISETTGEEIWRVMVDPRENQPEIVGLKRVKFKEEYNRLLSNQEV